MYRTQTYYQTLLAPLMGLFSLLLIGAGIAFSITWVSHMGIITAVMAFCLFYILRF